MKTLKSLIVLFVCTLAINSTIEAQTFYLPSFVHLEFNKVSPYTKCGTSWTDQNVNMQIIQTGNEVPCPGNCYVQVAPNSIWLAPSQLKVDLSRIILDAPIDRVEIHIKAHNSIGGTAAAMFDKYGNFVDFASNKVNGTSELLILNNPSAKALSRVMLSGCETELIEINIYSKKYIPSSEIEFGQVEVLPGLNPHGFGNTVQFGGN